ncbi:TonB-dependent siderophore receptor [Acetobacter tropicalis]|uniref:TonB-dependent siderophore receptor n=1 Tax=Acetobacter tropicalis TaxID=104102 RepID=UPI003974B24A
MKSSAYHVLPRGNFACFLMVTTTLSFGVVDRAMAATATIASQQSTEQAANFHIAAQPLGSALAIFGQQAGYQITADGNLTRGVVTKGVSGTMSASLALQQLLSGSGLSYMAKGHNAFVIVKASANITLGPVRVGGTVAHEDPTGPGIGYVATNTMTATKTDTPITQIPNSIYVVTKQQMVDQQAQRLTEALRYSPGIFAEPQGTNNVGASGSGIKQRGFSTSEFVDGLMTNSQSATETAFLDRIDVVNGPSSVMYGQTTPGGMIGVSLKKPTATPLHQVSVGFGNWGRYEATADVSDKITKSGNVRYRVAAIGVTQDTQMDYVKYKRVGVLPSLTWDIDRKTSLSLIGEYMYTPATGAAQTAYSLYGTAFPGSKGYLPRSAFLGTPSFNNNTSTDAMFEYQFKHEFSKYITFMQTFRWEKSKRSTEYMVFSDPVSLSEILRNPWASAGTNRNVTLDTRLMGHLDTGPVSHTWIVGSDFRQIDNTSHYQTAGTRDVVDVYNPRAYDFTPCLATPWTCPTHAYIQNLSYFQEGIYFQDQIKWKGVSVLLGGRQDWYNRTFVGGTRTYSSDGNATNSLNAPSTVSQSAFTWRGGLVYNFDFGLTPYFSYSSSFTPQFGTTDYQNHPFAPLTGKQLEAGLKYKVPGRDILLTGSVFHINENHYLITDTAHPNFSADAGRVRSQGVELSVSANITKDLHVMGSYTYTDMRYAKSNLLTQTFDPHSGTYGADVRQEGKYVEGIPRNMMSIFFDYTLPRKIAKGFGVNWGIRYTGFTYDDDANSYKMPSYLLLDVGAHYDFGELTSTLKGLQAQLAISNLSNKYYVTTCGTYQCYLGQGRRVYGNISYSW